jgi:hypothetical protein
VIWDAEVGAKQLTGDSWANDRAVVDRCAIVLYTATAGAQGTLGGLVATAPQFASILDRATHGVGCHGCLLIAETSCEMRNLFLDRNLLVPTMVSAAPSFFAGK